MNEQSKLLKEKAVKYCIELSEHEILKKYWDNLTLILKGSTARGNADQYSDIDFVFYSDEVIRKKIIEEYYLKGLTKRTDGVFLPLPEWIGHYQFESYETLNSYFIEKDYPQVWEYTNVIIMHDPLNKYKIIIDSNSKNLFSNPCEEIKSKYLELQLTLDWLRHPLKRGDKIAVLIHSSKIVKIACQLSYLLDKMSYPHDKWIFQYIDNTRFGKSNKKLILEYAENILNEKDIEKNLELNDYPQYYNAENIVKILSDLIKDDYGSQPWIDEWYLHV